MTQPLADETEGEAKNHDEIIEDNVVEEEDGEEKDGGEDGGGGLTVPGIDEWHEGYDVNDMSIIRNCYCVNCHNSTGMTTMLPTKVPYFREIIIMHFRCSECYFQNSEINFGGQIQEYGQQMTLTITQPSDYNRQLIKSDSATITIPKLNQFEIPASTQRGSVSTIEGILRTAANNLEAGQAQRLLYNDIENFHRCQSVIQNLRHFVDATEVTNVTDATDTPSTSTTSSTTTTTDEGSDTDLIGPIFPFDLILNDIAGNSYIENIMAPKSDPQLQIIKYNRTPQQDMMLGLQPSSQAIIDGTIDDNNPLHKNSVNATHHTLYQNKTLSQQQQQQPLDPIDNSSSNNNVNNNDTYNHKITTSTTTTNITTTPVVTPLTDTIDQMSDETTVTTNQMHLNDIMHSDTIRSTVPGTNNHTMSSNNNNNNTTTTTTTTTSTNIGRNEVMKFSTHCSNCYKETETDMCIVDIPHFKEVIIMSMLCEYCGYKSNEIKGGGGIPKFGCTITLRCTSPNDLLREVLKSDTAGIAIPEIDLELEEGGLDGLYTTIEGLIIKIRDRLESSNPFGSGDSNRKHHLHSDGGDYSNEKPIYEKYQDFLQQLTLMSQGLLLPCTIVLSDPLSNSFIGPIPKDAIALSLQAEQDGNRSCYDNFIDPNMTIEEYTRTFEQNELLGLNDMKTENYISVTDMPPQHNSNKTNTTTTTTTGTTNDSSDDGVVTDVTTTMMNYGTDQMEELPDRIRRIDVRGPDHPHFVGKAPVENDTTIMGPGSLNFAVPSIGQRTTTVPVTDANVDNVATGDSTTSTTGTSSSDPKSSTNVSTNV